MLNCVYSNAETGRGAREDSEKHTSLHSVKKWSLQGFLLWVIKHCLPQCTAFLEKEKNPLQWWEAADGTRAFFS